MKNIYSKFIILTLIFIGSFFSAQAQFALKIGDNDHNLNPNAVFELESTNKGLLLPRVTLTGSANVAPLAAHVAGMAVYNTATAGNVTPGYYYNDGTQWVRLSGASNTALPNGQVFVGNASNFATAVAMSGDVTLNNAGVATIAADAVTNAKMANMVALSIKGNGTNASENPTDLAAGTDGHVMRRSGTSLGFGTVVSAGIEDNTIVNADLNNVTAGVGGIYKGSGSLAGATTVTQGANDLTFTGAGNINKLSGVAGSSSIINLGRTATEADLGVAGANGQGLPNTVAGDLWLKSNAAKLSIGTSGNFATTISTNNTERMRVDGAGNVGIGTATPDASSILDLTATNKGFLPPRMTTIQVNAIASPANGLIVYNISLSCLQVNVGTPAVPIWVCMGSSTTVANCDANGFAGTYLGGVALSGASFSVTVTNNSFSTAIIAFATGDLVLSGVTGLTVGAPTGSPALSSGQATLTAGQSVVVTYPITGTPGCGLLSGNWTKITLNCVRTTSVVVGDFVTTASAITRSGSNITAFTANWSAVAGATGYTLEYSTTSTGPWTAFPSNPYSGISANITGLNAVQYWYRATVIGGSCAGISGIVSAGCGAFVSAGVYKGFMCHNLGADQTLNPHLPIQAIHGNYYQWGRAAVVATASTPSGSIGGWNTSSAPDNSWGTASGDNFKNPTNDPCPVGFRVPTKAEWDGVVNPSFNTVSRTGTWADSPSNFGSAIHYGPSVSVKTITLPAAGYRNFTDGTLLFRGSNGYYRSSTENSTNAWSLLFGSSSASTYDSNRAYGFSVRCVSE